MSANNLSGFYRRVFFLLLFLSPIVTWAQRENNHWTFGYQLGLQFDTGVPVFFPNSVQTAEGCAAVSNSNGQLLFYSNGNKVFDANHNVMPNGNGLLGNLNAAGHGSAFQGVVITPAIGNSNRYYLFTLDPIELVTPAYPGYLRYSVVDMSLNGGLGDVVAGQKNTVLDSMLGEKMTTATGAGCYNWLMVHEQTGNRFHAYKIDLSGVSAIPVISTSGQSIPTSSHIGYQMKMSPNDSLLINTSFRSAELHDFNRATGILSNARPVAIDTMAVNYGCEFSPDGSKLYFASSIAPIGLTQYDLSLLPNMTSVNNSRTRVNQTARLADIRAAPDGKLYIIDLDANRLAVVSNPGLPGAACGYVPDAGIVFPSLPLSLGTKVIRTRTDTTTYYSHDTLVCFGPPLMVAAPAGYSRYTWSDGSSLPVNTFTSGGIKWVAATNGCGTRIDTFRVTDAFADFDNLLGADTVLCAGDSILLNATVPGGQYTWNDGSHDPLLIVTRPGNYTVSISAADCRKTSTINISERKLQVELGDNRSVCEGEEILLDATTTGVQYLWQDGSSNATLHATTSGIYWVRVSQSACNASDTLMINFHNCNCMLRMPTAFTPNNDGRNDTYKPVIYGEPESYELKIYNRWGQCVFTSFDAHIGWDGTFNNRTCDLGTFFYKVRLKCFRGQEERHSGEMILVR
jgi:gliding motility-associated-like protein